jgi:Zn-dependent protease
MFMASCAHRFSMVRCFCLSAWLIAVNLAHGGMWVGSRTLKPVSELTAWILAGVTTFGLFLSVFGHELSHALMARAEGIEIEEIVLHPFGGLARLRKEPESPRAEFRIAIAGPAASFLFGVVAFVLLLPVNRLGYETAGGVLLLLSAGNLCSRSSICFPDIR